ncbi:MAG: hypothetical protein H6566_08785 [Lewinellaceae bacterium]|nr:hypothetical protein [Lewinellaceae bacterium]
MYRLYGTYLCHLVLEAVGRGNKTVKAVMDDIGHGLEGRERRNLERRVRNALKAMEAEGLVSKEWALADKIPVQHFKPAEL